MANIHSTWLRSCNANITPSRISTTPHNFAMFSPTTTAAIHNCRGQQPSIAVSSSSHTPPLLDEAAAHARGSVRSDYFLSGATTEVGRGGGAKSNNPYSPPSRLLSFASVGGDTSWNLGVLPLSLALDKITAAVIVSTAVAVYHCPPLPQLSLFTAATPSLSTIVHCSCSCLRHHHHCCRHHPPSPLSFTTAATAAIGAHGTVFNCIVRRCPLPSQWLIVIFAVVIILVNSPSLLPSLLSSMTSSSLPQRHTSTLGPAKTRRPTRGPIPAFQRNEFVRCLDRYDGEESALAQ